MLAFVFSVVPSTVFSVVPSTVFSVVHSTVFSVVPSTVFSVGAAEPSLSLYFIPSAQQAANQPSPDWLSCCS